ncbi:hypothetical protein Plav_2606 [Parvibaculum lavamentivorans DS-1]|uniref:Uncharacterized protein n=1 Tax=Parvibaculum lavamentivorans (strain DS-1 / DSM 13023 / NCIMB 13966) TaxID=402881 RepID=A7HWD1_PARL1|nr:hypothetical protein [Parvibaculum lavamentivorans]ABS64214.1 hypothetical protein Plav_2606 [Parvibaculum lavamentivorans DS-1]
MLKEKWKIAGFVSASFLVLLTAVWSIGRSNETAGWKEDKANWHMSESTDTFTGEYSCYVRDAAARAVLAHYSEGTPKPYYYYIFPAPDSFYTEINYAQSRARRACLLDEQGWRDCNSSHLVDLVQTNVLSVYSSTEDASEVRSEEMQFLSEERLSRRRISLTARITDSIDAGNLTTSFAYRLEARYHTARGERRDQLVDGHELVHDLVRGAEMARECTRRELESRKN